jgi:rhodanese-related sulfurtransferase
VKQLSTVNPLHNIFLRTSILILTILVQAAIAAGQDTSKMTTLPLRRCGFGRYCGIYSLYAVMKLSDVDVDPKELLKPEYIGSHQGSSLAELKKAAEDNGLYAVPVGKLTSRELRQSSYPVILHVKSDPEMKIYNHYELFLETKNGQARLYNPPEQVRLVPFYELAPRWDGTGLIVAPSPIDLGTLFAPTRMRFIIYASIAVALILVAYWGRRHWLPKTALVSRRRLFGLSIVASAGFVFSAIFCGMLCHFVNEEGFLAHTYGIASIKKAYLGTFIPKVTEKKVRKLLNTDTVFIDARFVWDFEAGHLEGAINIPANASDDERRKTMADIAKDARLVVYSQSAGCKFAEMVAIQLMSDGFSNVSIFRGGWSEWEATHDK